MPYTKTTFVNGSAPAISAAELNKIGDGIAAAQATAEAAAPATHSHAASDIDSGTIAPARLGSGTANSGTVLYGDGTWKTAPSGGTVPDASTTVKGIVELATSAEASAGTDTVRAVTPAGLAAALAAAPPPRQAINAQTGTAYTPAAADEGKLVTLTNSAAITVTLPASDTTFPVGARIDLAALGVGMVTFVAGPGATANGTPSLVTRAQYSAVSAVKAAPSTWLVIGDLA